MVGEIVMWVSDKAKGTCEAFVSSSKEACAALCRGKCEKTRGLMLEVEQRVDIDGLESTVGGRIALPLPPKS